jgi:hypothetical protein
LLPLILIAILLGVDIVILVASWENERQKERDKKAKTGKPKKWDLKWSILLTAINYFSIHDSGKISCV